MFPLTESDDTQHTEKVYKITTTGRQKFGDTKGLPCLPLDHPDLIEFSSYLTSIAGGRKSVAQARQFCVDLGKFLMATSPESPSINDVLTYSNICNYMDKLSSLSVGPSGQAAKLNVLKKAVKYLTYRWVDTGRVYGNFFQVMLSTACQMGF